MFDQTALAAAHPTIQLPAIARLTNLENGRQVIVRVNDRGSGDPRRLVEITRRTALLLGVPPGGVARVRLQVLPGESHAAADALPGAPSLGDHRGAAWRGSRWRNWRRPRAFDRATGGRCRWPPSWGRQRSWPPHRRCVCPRPSPGRCPSPAS